MICRFCKDYCHEDCIKYGVRHYAHHRCYLEAGKPLSALQAWQVGSFPARLLSKFNLNAEASRILGEYEAKSKRVLSA